LVLVDFQAPWCATLFLEELGAEGFIEEWGNMVGIGTIDATRYSDLAIRYRIQEIPTIVLFDHGRVLKSFKGPSRVWEIARHVFTFQGLREIGVLTD
jgi:thioredoxin-like negative regulator of GroEL